MIKLPALFAFALAIFFTSCSKDTSEIIEEEIKPVDIVTVTATSANDTKSGGVYKGVLVGSTGSIKLVLQQDLKAIYIKFDGVSKTLTTTDLANWTSGQAITNATFTSGDWKVVFSVGAAGNDPVMVVTIPGHSVRTAAVKETSTSATTAFEGRFSVSGQSSTFNFVVKGTDTIMGAILTTDAKSIGLFGRYRNNVIGATADTGTGRVQATGTINGNTASGTFTEIGYGGNNYNISGTWTATKTF